MPIDKTAWLEDYKSGARLRSDKWLNNYKATPDKLAKAASDDAQKLYEDQMKDPKVLKRRQSKLKKLSESDLNAAADAAGSTAYATGVEAKAGKALKNVSIYLDEIDRLKPTMPKRTTDPMSNLTNRAGHFVKGLSELKKRQV